MRDLKVLKHLVLCVVIGPFFAFVPPLALVLVAVIVWRLAREERPEFLTLFVIVCVVPILGFLSWVVLNPWHGTLSFLSLAVLKDFFSWFRADRQAYAADSGPALTPAELEAVMIGAFLVGALAAIAYPWFLLRRLNRGRLPN